MTSKEALKRLYCLGQILMKKMQIEFFNNEEIEKDYMCVKQDLERFEKLEKVIDILKGKIEFEDLGESHHNFRWEIYTNYCVDDQDYELLKEVLVDDK